MSLDIIKRRYLDTIGGYIEITAPFTEKGKYKVRFNWDLTEANDPSRGMVIAGFATRDYAEKLYDLIVFGDPDYQTHMVDEYYRRLSNRNPFKDIRFKYHQSDLRREFQRRGLFIDVEDPHQDTTYELDEVIDDCLEEYFANTREEAHILIRDIASAYGVYAPKLYWGKKEIKGAVKAGLLKSDILRNKTGVGEHNPESNSLLIKDEKVSTTLHEMAHHVTMCAVAPNMHTSHGEMFNRVYIQILEKFSPVSSEPLFETAKALGLFRPEVEFADVMRPIGMLAQMPLLDAPESEMT